MSVSGKHISVCVCTFKRPELLRRLLDALAGQESRGQFVLSIVVVDNDEGRSAEDIVSDFAVRSPVAVKYCPEPRQGIALARNKAVENATGDLVAFIDDDEFPISSWLVTLLQALENYNVDGVLGPVRPHFDGEPPNWLVEGKFHERPEDQTGHILDWGKCRTGNVLLQRTLFLQEDPVFRPECRTGEDQDFFRRMIEKGHKFVWCNEAVAYEVVPPARWKRSFLVRRALFRGVFSLRNYGFPTKRILQSVMAVPAYTAALPVALFMGQSRFMGCVFKLSYHVGRLLAVVGIDPIGQPYLTD
jgi:glycosyltransferase involved in cell wall biosynthesis